MVEKALKRITYLTLEGLDKVKVYYKEAEKVNVTFKNYYPIFYITNRRYINGFQEKYWIKELNGKGEYKYLLAFPNISIMWKALRWIEKELKIGNDANNIRVIDSPEILIKTEPTTQFLLQTDLRLFEDLYFGDLKRIQMEIIPYSNKPISRTLRVSDNIAMISIKNGSEIIHLDFKKKNEIKLLNELMEILVEIDPDIIEGHRINSNLIPYINERAKFNELELILGRNDSVIELEPTKFFDNDTYDVKVDGRLLVDTFFLLNVIDQYKKDLDSYSLLPSAKFYGLEIENEIEIPPSKFGWYYDNDKEILQNFIQNRLNAVEFLTTRFLPYYFYQTKKIPLNFNEVLKLGLNNKIEKILLSDYIEEKQSIPSRRITTNDFSNLYFQFYSGIYKNIFQIKLNNLLGSILLKFEKFSKYDEIDSLYLDLQELNNRKLFLQNELKTITDEKLRFEYSNEFNVVEDFISGIFLFSINNKNLFYDESFAKKITTTYRQIVNNLYLHLEENNIKLIDIDSENVIISCPQRCDESKDKLIEIFKKFNQKFELNVDALFKKSFERILYFKRKSYVLQTYEKRLILKGSYLWQKNIEKYAKDFIQLCIESMIREDISDLSEVYKNLLLDLINHNIKINDLAKTETIREPLEEYKQELLKESRQKSAIYELALKYYEKSTRVGNKISYYITGNDPLAKPSENCELVENYDPKNTNENVYYYIKKLEEYLDRFKIFFSEEDFKSLFPDINSLGFAPREINILNLEYELNKVLELNEE